jgi:hypothetical protein
LDSLADDQLYRSSDEIRSSLNFDDSVVARRGRKEKKVQPIVFNRHRRNWNVKTNGRFDRRLVAIKTTQSGFPMRAELHKWFVSVPMIKQVFKIFKNKHASRIAKREREREFVLLSD